MQNKVNIEIDQLDSGYHIKMRWSKYDVVNDRWLAWRLKESGFSTPDEVIEYVKKVISSEA
jgi:hypothetical protein